MKDRPECDEATKGRFVPRDLRRRMWQQAPNHGAASCPYISEPMVPRLPMFIAKGAGP